MSKKPAAKSFMAFSIIAIPIIFTISVLIFIYVFGDASHFDKTGAPKAGDFFGMIYKGGFVVPLLMTLFLCVITFSIERFITISKAKGKGNIRAFVAKIHTLVSAEKLDEAITECDRQRGSVANVIRSGLVKYKEMMVEKTLNRDQKVAAIKQEIEEATALELPMLEQNLVIIATITSIGTLFALLGTVLGMIRAFAGMANAGAPDSAALATGISEALINTAIGIATSALAVVAYSFFTTKIDKMTYSIDEAGVAIVQNFYAKNS